MSNQLYQNDIKLFPFTDDIVPISDNTIDLGSSDRRFKHIHVANQTSTNITTTNFTASSITADSHIVNEVILDIANQDIRLSRPTDETLLIDNNAGSDATLEVSHIICDDINVSIVLGTQNIADEFISDIANQDVRIARDSAEHLLIDNNAGSDATLQVAKYEIGDANFSMEIDAGEPTITLDSGDTITFDRAVSELNVNLDGNPNPDLKVANGNVQARDMLSVGDSSTFISKTTTGPTNGDVTIQLASNDLMYWDDSANQLALNITSTEKLHINESDAIYSTRIGVGLNGSVVAPVNETPIYIKNPTNNCRYRATADTALGNAGILVDNQTQQVFMGVGDTVSNKFYVYSNTYGYSPIGFFPQTNRNVLIGDESVGSYPFNPDASALVDMQTNNKGFLEPRMTTAQRTAIASPAIGLQVYDTDLSAMYVYDGTSWKQVSPINGTVTTNWTFPGAVGAVAGNINYQLMNNIASITIPLISNAANGFNAFISNATTLLSTTLRPASQKNWIIKVDNASVPSSGYCYILPTGEVRVYASVASTLFSGAAGTHTVNAVTLTYSLI